jgi:hypothetical protein
VKDLTDQIVEAISTFDFQVYDDTGDVDPGTTEAKDTWVYDLGEHIAHGLLPSALRQEQGQIDELVHKFLLEFGNARAINARGELVGKLKELLKQTVASAMAAGWAEEF